MPAVDVRLLEASAAARDRLESLRGVLWSLLNGWSEASMTGATNGKVGYTAGRLKWGEVPVALWIEQGLPVGSWNFGDGF